MQTAAGSIRCTEQLCFTQTISGGWHIKVNAVDSLNTGDICWMQMLDVTGLRFDRKHLD